MALIRRLSAEVIVVPGLGAHPDFVAIAMGDCQFGELGFNG